MKKLDKLILVLFSILIFLEAILIICTIVGWIDIRTISVFATNALENQTNKKIVLAITIVCLIFSIKCIFFESPDKDKKKTGILMQNDNGKLLISKPTIENIVISVVKEFNSVQDISVKIDMDNLNNLIVNVNLSVTQNVIIKELTVNMQNKIKEAIKRTSDLEVKQVNVRIKDIIMETKDKE